MLFHNFMMWSPLISSICLIVMKEWTGKSRHNRNFDYFHPSTHTYAKVTIHIHSIILECIGTLCHSRAISVVSYCFIGILITALEVFNICICAVYTIHWHRDQQVDPHPTTELKQLWNFAKDNSARRV